MERSVSTDTTATADTSKVTEAKATDATAIIDPATVTPTDPATVTPTDPATVTPTDPATTTEEGKGAEESKGNAEAATYRRKLRDTEAERDGLAARVEKMQRADVERRATERLHQASDVWLFGLNLAEFHDDDRD